MKKYIHYVVALIGLLLLPQLASAQEKVSSVAHFYYYPPVKIYKLDAQGNRVDNGAVMIQEDMKNQATFVQIELQKDTIYTGMFHVDLNADCTFSKYKFYAGMGFPLANSKLKFGYDCNGKICSLTLEDASTRLTLDKTAKTIIFTYMEYDMESAVQSRPELYNAQGPENAERLKREDHCQKVMGPKDFNQQFDYLVTLLHKNW